MGESTGHIYLVESLNNWIADHFFNGDKGGILIDSPDSPLTRKPPRINGYTPDVFATVNGVSLIIGEAKTAADLENEHTEEQLTAFLQYCDKQVGSSLVIAVPWYMTRCAKATLSALQRRAGTCVKTYVIDQLAG